MLIYEALKKDHDKIKTLLAQLLATSPNKPEERHEIVEQIRDEIIPHSRAEEAVFYNTLRSIDMAKDLVLHCYQEHLEIETYLRMLQVRDKIDVEWKETAQKLKTALEKHIHEEETKIFSAAKQLFTTREAEMMGEAFVRLKPDIRREGFVSTTLDMVVNMMPPRFTSVFRKNNLQARI